MAWHFVQFFWGRGVGGRCFSLPATCFITLPCIVSTVLELCAHTRFQVFNDSIYFSKYHCMLLKKTLTLTWVQITKVTTHFCLGERPHDVLCARVFAVFSGVNTPENKLCGFSGVLAPEDTANASCGRSLKLPFGSSVLASFKMCMPGRGIVTNWF